MDQLVDNLTWIFRYFTDKLGRQIAQLYFTLKWYSSPKTVRAIYVESADQLPNILDLTNASCIFCGRALDDANLGGWIKRDGQLVPFCDNISCYPIKEDDSRD